MTDDNEKQEATYVFDQTEVKLTGRTAETTLRSGKIDTLHEVTPVESIVGSWKKWVDLSKLPKVN